MQRVSVFNAHRRYRIAKKPVQTYVQRVLGTRKANIAVLFVGSRFCRFINKKYLHHNYATDVLSFSFGEKPLIESEIYVNLDKAKQQAREYDVSFGNEVARLVIHGALHLIGYDDQTKRGAQRMKAAEDKHVGYWFSARQRKTV